MNDVFTGVWTHKRDSVHWTEWLNFVAVHGVVCTTNYDDLATEALGALALLSSGSAPGAPALLEDGRLLGARSRRVPGHLTRLEFATDFWTAQRAGLLKDTDRFVHHLHGHHQKPEGMVLDAADYASAKSWVVEDQIIRALSQGDCLFFGVGEGMFDPHFTRLVTRARESTNDGRAMGPGGRNAWFLPRKTIGKTERGHFLERHGKDRLSALESVISIVEFDVCHARCGCFDSVPRELHGALTA